MNALAAELGVALVNVYILEAHAADEWALPDDNDAEGVCYSAPRTLADRLAIARDLVASQQLGDAVVLVDDLCNVLELAYEARPERLYVVERGRITFRSGPGPFMYSPDKLREFLISAAALAQAAE